MLDRAFARKLGRTFAVVASVALVTFVSGCPTDVASDNGTAVIQVGDTGPAGGIVFYDKGNYTDGWRYLEAAPVQTEWFGKPWGGILTLVDGTETGIGTGAANTAAIVDTLGNGEYAAKLCDDLEFGGYEDWFLPSKDELELIRQNLYVEGIGDFHHEYYWSSSEKDELSGWSNYFSLDEYAEWKDEGYRVRAVRAF